MVVVLAACRNGHAAWIGCAREMIMKKSGLWSVISTANTGLFSNPTIGTDIAGNGQSSQRPEFNASSGPEYFNYIPVTGNAFARQYVNKADFSEPAAGQLTDSLEAFQVRDPGEFDIDSGLARLFPVGEGRNFEFRAEFFNILNHENFGAPKVTFTSPAFGEITSTNASNNLRIGQLALKYNF
jgi:hypothetical protein